MKTAKTAVIICVFLIGYVLISFGCASGGGQKEQPEPPAAEPRMEEKEAELDLSGTWLGELDAGSTIIRIVFNIALLPEGGYAASMDSPDQGVSGIPVDAVVMDENSVVFKLSVIGGEYSGTVDEGGASISGEWKQAGSVFDMPLRKTDKVERVSRRQDPVPPYPYSENEVVFSGGAEGVFISGTLTIPGEGYSAPYPAAILVSGSGAQNRNDEIMNHRPFLVLADYLTRRGMAVLRYDERGVGESTGDFTRATTADLAGDTAAAVRYLRTREEIDPEGVGILGHSEGGLIAHLVAGGDDGLAFIVSLAGPGLPGDQLLLLQNRAIMKAYGMDEQTIEERSKINRQIYDILIYEPDDETAAAEIREILKFLGLPAERINATIETFLLPFFRFFLAYDPRPALRETSCPVLTLIGEKDLQVPPDENLPAIMQALEEGENDDYTVVALPGLNHLFQPAETGLIEEYSQIETTFDEGAMELIAGWLLERVTPAE